jgi:TPR repeat protein
MSQQSAQAPKTTSRLNLVWLICLIAAALVAGSFGGRYFERSQPTTPQGKVQDAVHALQSGYDENALAILKPLADGGNPKAQYWLADIYQNGLGVKPDMTTAISLLEKSAAQGFLPAEAHLGALYLRGNETLQDFGKAQV